MKETKSSDEKEYVNIVKKFFEKLFTKEESVWKEVTDLAKIKFMDPPSPEKLAIYSKKVIQTPEWDLLTKRKRVSKVEDIYQRHQLDTVINPGQINLSELFSRLRELLNIDFGFEGEPPKTENCSFEDPVVLCKIKPKVRFLQFIAEPSKRSIHRYVRKPGFKEFEKKSIDEMEKGFDFLCESWGPKIKKHEEVFEIAWRRLFKVVFQLISD